MQFMPAKARQIARVARRMARSACLGERFHHATIHCPRVTLGNSDAEFVLNPGLLSANSVIYSVGIGTDISFDLACIKQFSARIYAFDPTPRSLEWLAGQKLPSEFNYYQYGLAAYDGSLTLYPPENASHVSYAVVRRPGNEIACPVFKLSTIMKNLGHKHVDLLKMDIEGAEYDVIENMLADDIGPTQLCVEFHHRWAQIGIRRTNDAIDRLHAAGYRIFHVSASGEEFSFLRITDAD